MEAATLYSKQGGCPDSLCFRSTLLHCPCCERAKRSGSPSELCTVAMNQTQFSNWDLAPTHHPTAPEGKWWISQEMPCTAQVMRGQAESLIYWGTGQYKVVTEILGIIVFTFRSSIILLYFCMCMWHCHILFVSVLSSAEAQFLLLFQMLSVLVFFSQHCKSGVSPGRAMEDWSLWEENLLQYIFVYWMFPMCSRNKTQSAYS